jgi:hypothetical protein
VENVSLMLEAPQLLQAMAAAPSIAGVEVDPCTLGDLSKSVQEHLAAIWELFSPVERR